jgi:murein L,D-transpeptidase YcbB/YkuD
MMRLLKLAATSSLAALVLTLGVDQLKADHDGWFGRGVDRANPRQSTQPYWWQRQAAPPRQAAPSSRNDFFSGWFQPQYQLPWSQNVEPEAPPAKAPVIYTYQADPLVELADATLAPPARPTMRWRSSNQASEAIFAALKSGSSGVRVTAQQRDDIVAFYRERDFAPVWASAGGLDRAEGLLAELANADKHGLVPEDYLPSDLGSFTDDLGALNADQERLARLDLALTAAALRYAMHASGGRLVPTRISAYHDLKPPTVDGRQALTRLANEASPAAYLASLHPIHPAYEALRRELADLSAQTDRDDEPIADGPAVKPGQTDARLPAIRARLAKLGHFSPATASTEEITAPIGIESGVPLFGSAETAVIIEVAMPDAGDPGPIDAEPIDAEPNTTEPSTPELNTPELNTPELSQGEAYDEATVEAVKAFQAATGLTVDGIIGQQTISALNSGNTEERIRRLVYNMERLRWMPRNFGAKHVLVNTASFETRVVENGATIWSSKVINGTPQNQTVFFSDRMETVVFNPYWGVPASIIVNEMLPEIYRDPSWLDREGYEVTDLNGQVISSYGVDWYNIDPKNLKFGVRQPPGPANALGEIKFLFPNKHSIYMHDTPSKPLFAKPMRAFSHGCVRVENPRQFAEIILGWDQQRIASTLASSRDYSVPVEEDIDVHVTYFTAWPDETGAIQYFEDVYGRDQLVERALGTLTVAMR